MTESEKSTFKQKLKDTFTKYLFVTLSLIPQGTKENSFAQTMQEKQASSLTVPQSDVLSSDTEDFIINEDRVGNWTLNDLNFSSEINDAYKRPEIKSLPDNPDDFIPKGKVRFLPSEKMIISQTDTTIYATALTHNDGSIDMSMPDSMRVKAAKSQETKRFLSGDSTARLAVFCHEVNHSKDIIYLNVTPQYQTPINTSRLLNMSENISFSVSYLTTAYMYQTLKNKGVSTIQINGEERPLETVLDTYPDLRETYEKYGLDINDPGSTKRYAELGVAYKNAKKSEYDKQAYIQFVKARTENKKKPFAARVAEAYTEDADFNKISHLMASKVYIEQNTCVDLSHCYDIFNDMSKQDVFELVEKQSHGEEHVVPAENFIAIDKYLTQKNIADSDKDAYITDQFFSIISNNEDTDNGLKTLMAQSHTFSKDEKVQSQNCNSKCSKTISFFEAASLIHNNSK